MKLNERSRQLPLADYLPDWLRQALRRGRSVFVGAPDAVRPASRPENRDEIDALVVRIYKLALDRTPKPDELQSWSEQIIGHHLSAAAMVEAISTSPEASVVREFKQQVRKTLSESDTPGEIDALVVRIYQLVLDRTPNAAEIQVWTKQVLDHHLSAAGMVETIATSPEADLVRERGQMLPEVPNGRFVQFAYEFLLGRGAMAAEIVHWDYRLNRHNLSRDRMVASLFTQRATHALTENEQSTAYDPNLAYVMGTDTFIDIKEWQRRADAIGSGAQPFSPKVYPSLAFPRRSGILVSAIASLYRGGDYIEQFLENITSQTIFESCCELIIIDADSPENEFAVIAEYMKRFPNIVYHRASTRIGIYEAWNVGVEMSRGQYITNTNLDDLRRHDSFERQVEILEKFQFVDVVYQDFYYSFDGKASVAKTAMVGVQSNVPIISPYNLMRSNSPHNAPMWRRALHEDVGLFDASFRSAGDYDFWLRCVQAGKVFYKVNDPHVIYFVNPEGLSTQPNTRGIDEANRITLKYGRMINSPWLLCADDVFLAEASKDLGSSIELSEAERALPDWRYAAVQRAMRVRSIVSRASNAVEA